MGELRILSDSSEPFSGRVEAGELLAAELEKFGGESPAALGIPRGGLVIAEQIAIALGGDLDMVLSHKLGAPGNPELAIGAICEDGTVFVDEALAAIVRADTNYIEQEREYQLEQIKRRAERYRRILSRLSPAGRVVIVTDDGIATGATMQAALWAIRQQSPEKIVLAVPVGAEESVVKLARDADETICLRAPPYFGAIGRFYVEFGQVEDEELVELLEREQQRRSG